MAARKPRPSRKEAEKLVSAIDARRTSPDDLDDDLPPFAVDVSGPSELDGLGDDVWVKASGATPLEFLTHTYRNGFQRMEHRISAAKAVLDYTHRKLPARVELSGDLGGRNVQLDAVALAKLSDKELEQMMKLLEKIGG